MDNAGEVRGSRVAFDGRSVGRLVVRKIQDAAIRQKDLQLRGKVRRRKGGFLERANAGLLIAQLLKSFEDVGESHGRRREDTGGLGWVEVGNTDYEAEKALASSFGARGDSFEGTSHEASVQIRTGGARRERQRRRRATDSSVRSDRTKIKLSSSSKCREKSGETEYCRVLIWASGAMPVKGGHRIQRSLPKREPAVVGESFREARAS